MKTTMDKHPKRPDEWQNERQEWLESLWSVYRAHGPDRTSELLKLLDREAIRAGIVSDTVRLNTPYRNTIPAAAQPPYPGDVDLENRIEKIIRWNALAMVIRASDSGAGVGGHIATYASAATLLEVGFNHVFRNASDDYGGGHR